MARFSYNATTPQGTRTFGVVEAKNREAALDLILQRGLKPIAIKEAAAQKKGFSIGGNKVKSDYIVIFTRELSAMVGAGVPLLRALSSLGEHTESPQLRKILEAITKDIEGGAALGDALAKHPGTFNDVYVNMVRAGEAAGILDDILKRLALQQEKNATMRKKIKSAMTYPIVLMTIAVIAFFGLMIFVIPQIGGIVKDLGGPDAKLPGLTVFMLALSAFMVKFWYILLPAVVGSILALMRYIKTPKGRRMFHIVALKIPGVKGIIMKVAVARFARTFSALIGAGVAVLEALDVTAHAVGNSLYEEAILAAAEQVENGATLSSIIEKNPLFPAIVPQMLSVGEETGQTDTVLVKVADFYEEEVDVAIDGMSSIIEPVMIVFMGGVVGLIAASVMLPIANLSQSIKA